MDLIPTVVWCIYHTSLIPRPGTRLTATPNLSKLIKFLPTHHPKNYSIVHPSKLSALYSVVNLAPTSVIPILKCHLQSLSSSHMVNPQPEKMNLIQIPFPVLITYCMQKQGRTLQLSGKVYEDCHDCHHALTHDHLQKQGRWPVESLRHPWGEDKT